MRVLQINSVCGIGSTGRIASDINDYLIQQGHESYIAYGRGNLKNYKNTFRIGNSFDNFTHLIKTRFFDMHGFGSFQATKKFIEKVREVDPDIIHLHNLHGYYINIDVFFDYLKKANKPVVWTLHDCWSFTGHCAHFDYIGCKKWQHRCGHCPLMRKYPSSLFIDNSENNYIRKRELFTGINNLTIVTPSKWLEGLVMKSFLKEYPLEVINNGINLEVFKPTGSNFRKIYALEEKFIILGVATAWGKNKGLDYFVRLSKTLNESEVIVLVGLKEEKIHKLPENIVGIARTNMATELAEIYSSADVFINPTLEDTFPTTNLESLACGTPVITFNTGGSPECIDESCGFIIEKENFEELSIKIRVVKEKGKLHYYDKCLQRALLNYNREDRFNDYINTYLASLIKGRVQ